MVSLVVDDRRVTLTGRAAAIAALIAKHQTAINAMSHGKLEANFALKEIVVTLQESLERIKIS